MLQSVIANLSGFGYVEEYKRTAKFKGWRLTDKGVAFLEQIRSSGITDLVLEVEKM